MAFYPEVFFIYAVNSLQFASPLGDNTRNNLYEIVVVGNLIKAIR